MLNTIKYRLRVLWRNILESIDKRPLLSFFVALGVFLALIVISNFLRQPPKQAEKAEKAPKTVTTYTIGTAPKVRVQAQVEKSGVVQITALMGGVVQSINFQPGQQVSRGSNVVGLSTNYQGGNTFSVQRQQAQVQYQNLLDTYDTQKEIIKKQREKADKFASQSAELRDISSQSVDETQALIDLNIDILNTLETNLDQLEATHSATSDNSSLILQAKQAKAGLIGTTNQLQSAVRASRYNVSSEQEPAALSELDKDITQKQLDLQEKTLDVNKEVSRLQLQIAYITEALMYPASPFSGTVERVFVKVGQSVQPGTPLMVISQTAEDDPITAVAYVSREVATKVSYLEPSVLHLGNSTYEVNPSYVSQEAVQGSLYAVYYNIPDNYTRQVTEKGYIQVDIPIGGFDTGAAVPFIPLDSVYQSQDEDYIFVIEKGKAKNRQVKLGAVYGRFVEVQSGLYAGDRVIVDRNVVEGDIVKVQ